MTLLTRKEHEKLHAKLAAKYLLLLDFHLHKMNDPYCEHQLPTEEDQLPDTETLQSVYNALVDLLQKDIE